MAPGAIGSPLARAPVAFLLCRPLGPNAPLLPLPHQDCPPVPGRSAGARPLKESLLPPSMTVPPALDWVLLRGNQDPRRELPFCKAVSSSDPACYQTILAALVRQTALMVHFQIESPP